MYLRPKLFKFFLIVLLACFNSICFSQDDSEIVLHYATDVHSVNFEKNTQPLFLAKINSSTADFKKQYKNAILRQLSNEWFVVNKSLSETNFFKRVLPANNNYKLSGAFFSKNLNRSSVYSFIIKATDSSLFLTDVKPYKQLHVQSAYKENFYLVKARLSFIMDTLINNDYIQSIDIKPQPPKQETVINDYDNSVNAINLFFANHPSINGNGLTASVKENLFDTFDIDFKSRYVASSISSDTISSHATIMATLIAGGGNSFQTAKGIAWSALLTSSDFANLLPDADNYFNQYHVSVQNNSYGVGIENFYGNDAVAYDQSTIENPDLLYVFSAGNSGSTTPPDGNYKNINGFSNLTGSFKQAKNILTVGSVDSFYNIPVLSSKGPAYDGRIKPELVAYGNDGSSGAAAITSGTVLAVQSAYTSVHHDSLPQNALVKAIIINSADDVFNAGPDFYSGFGNVNVNNAVTDALSDRHYSGKVEQDETKDFIVHIPSDISNVKFTLVWNDPAAQPNAFSALVNDLDLTVENATDHTVYQPWVLNSIADSAKLLNIAVRNRDSLNNIEQVTISNPAQGDYIIHVKGYDVSANQQSFYVAYRFDTANSFAFISPVNNTHFNAGGNSIFRWTTTFTSTNVKLEYSFDKGKTWKLISNAVNLSKKYLKWLAPDTNVVALARIIINNKTFYSGTFDISKQIYPQVGFNCSDSSLIYWNKQAGADKYKIYGLGSKYLQPLITTSDTSYIIKNTSAQYVAVAPVFDNHTGVNGYTFNVATQGVSCYISNFLADADGSNADLKLTLGTTYNVKKVEFEKFLSGAWSKINEVNAINNINIISTASLQQGINYYRAIVTLFNGDTIISNESGLYYFKNADYIIAPNPVSQGKHFYILSNNVSSNTLVLFDMIGRKLYTEKIEQQHQQFTTAQFAKGIYIAVIFDDNKKIVFKTKIVVD